jgi:predicted O-methyltransferase YrrM
MYRFIHDFFSQTIPIAEEHLAEFKDVPVNFLEIGAFEGRSTVWFLDNILTHPRSCITSIDPWVYSLEAHKPVFEHYRYNISHHPGKVIYYHDSSTNVLVSLMPELYSFIFVDGDHSSRGILEDAVLSFRLLKSGGIMAFDDYLMADPQYLTDGTTPKESLDAFLYAYRNYLTVLHKDWQVWIRKN